MDMPTRKVTIGEDTYEFYLTGGYKAFNASKKFFGEITSLLPNLITKNSDSFNIKVQDIIEKDFEVLFNTFIDKNSLKCNGELITNFETHFAGKFTDIPVLLYKVIMENDKDFFLSLPTLAEKAVKFLNENLPVNSLKNPGETMDALTKAATQQVENLGLNQ